MQSRYFKFAPIFRGIVDLLVLNLSFILAAQFKFGTITDLIIPPYSFLFVWYNVVWIMLVSIFKPYKNQRTKNVYTLIKKHVRLLILQLLLVTFFIVAQKGYYYSREHLLFTYSISILLLILNSGIYIIAIRRYRAKGFNFRNVVILGNGKISKELELFFQDNPETGYKFLGFFSNEHDSKRLGSIDSVLHYAIKHNVNEIYCCIPYVDLDMIQKIINFGEENLIKVKLLADYGDLMHRDTELEKFGVLPILNVLYTPLEGGLNEVLKRLFDILFSLLVIVSLLSWLFPIISLLIWITDGRPILFRQKRTGKDNKSFTCLKLRNSSLDELPQFINVFLGDMSIVGPRPHMLTHTKEFNKKLNKFNSRHSIKPGITGLAQARGYRGETKTSHSLEGRIKLDRFYINKWSMFFDVKIIFLTVKSLVLKRRND